MNKFALIAAFALIALPFAAQADDHAPHEAAPAVEATTSMMAAPAVEAKEATLKNGTKVVIEGETVSVVAEDGTKTTAPDGEHELADGTKVHVKDGKIVEPAMEAPVTEAPVSEAPVSEAPATE